MTTDLTLVDTNVLVYSFFRDHPFYPASAHLIDHAQTSAAGLCVVPQVLAEFYAVITNPRRVSAPFTASEALAELANIRTLPGLIQLPVPLDIVDRWSALLKQRPVTGHDFFDAQLVGAMLGNGVKKIYTFNVKDFTPFPELEVLEPPSPPESQVAEEREDP